VATRKAKEETGGHKILYPAKQMAKEASKYCRLDKRSDMKS